MLALEDQLLEDVATVGEGELTGTLDLGASTGPAAIVLPLLLCEFQAENPGVKVSLTVADTHAVVEHVAARELELGIVGAARRQRGVAFEPFFRDEVILATPPDHPFAGRTVTLDELRKEPLIVMQEGGGVRQLLEDELRRSGERLRDFDVPLELGLQESVRSAVLAGYGVTFISRSAVETELAAGGSPRRACAASTSFVTSRSCAPRGSRRPGSPRPSWPSARNAWRDRPLGAGRAPGGSRTSSASSARCSSRASAGRRSTSRPRLRGTRFPRTASRRRTTSTACWPSAVGARSTPRRRRRRRERSAARLRPDHVLRLRVDADLRRARSRPEDGRRRRRRAYGGDRLRPEASPSGCRAPSPAGRR